MKAFVRIGVLGLTLALAAACSKGGMRAQDIPTEVAALKDIETQKEIQAQVPSAEPAHVAETLRDYNGYLRGDLGGAKGIRVGPRIGLPPATGCDPKLFDSFTRELLGRFPADVACNTINEAYVASFSYRGSNNKCYDADLTGTYEVACVANLPTLNATTALSYDLLPSAYDGNYNWNAARAVCWYTAGDIGRPGVYGVPYQMICGGRNALNSGNYDYRPEPQLPAQPVAQPSQPAVQPVVAPVVQPQAPAQAVTPVSAQPERGVMSDNNYNGYIRSDLGANKGIRVGPRIGLPPATGCDSSLFDSFTRELLGRFPADVACNTIGTAFVAAFSYQGSDGKCYEADLTGTYEIKCTATLPRLAATTSIRADQLPNPYDARIDWNAGRAVCWYTAGDIGRPGVYGVPYQMICGGRDILNQ